MMSYLRSVTLVFLLILKVLTCLFLYLFLQRNLAVYLKANSWKYGHVRKMPRYLITGYMISDESSLAHKLLDHLKGIEIGPSSHNPFGLNAINVDVSLNNNTYFKREQLRRTGTSARIDIVASGDQLPFADNSQDFVISAHVIEHFYDPIKAIKEWLRVIKPGGIVYIIAPHKQRTFDSGRARTTLGELLHRHENSQAPEIDDHRHYSVWITHDLIQLCRHFKWRILAVQDVDDKVGNGFTVVLQKDF